MVKNNKVVLPLYIMCNEKSNHVYNMIKVVLRDQWKGIGLP